MPFVNSSVQAIWWLLLFVRLGTTLHRLVYRGCQVQNRAADGRRPKKEKGALGLGGLGAHEECLVQSIKLVVSFRLNFEL